MNKTETTASIIDRTPNVEAALAIAGKTIEQVINTNDSKDENAYKVIKAVIKVLNEDWVADHSDASQVKYEPRFYYKSGFGLSYFDIALWFSFSAVGGRLCYCSYEVMMHGMKILESYYNDYLNH